jgi:hypothetical protein
VAIYGDVFAGQTLYEERKQVGQIAEGDGFSELDAGNEFDNALTGDGISPVASLHCFSTTPITWPLIGVLAGASSHCGDRYIATAALSSFPGRCSPSGNTSVCTIILTASRLAHRLSLFNIHETTRSTRASFP